MILVDLGIGLKSFLVIKTWFLGKLLQKKSYINHDEFCSLTLFHLSANHY
jgi:hypothetical protein